MRSQTDRLIERLKEGPVNPLQSWTELGIYRLGARVYDAKARGINISKRTIKVKNKFGENCRVAEYFIDN